MPRPRTRALSSAGEHYVDIVGVGGSIPPAPTIKPGGFRPFLRSGQCHGPVLRGQNMPGTSVGSPTSLGNLRALARSMHWLKRDKRPPVRLGPVPGAPVGWSQQERQHLCTPIAARATAACPAGVDAGPRPGQTDHVNGPKVRRELTGRPVGSNVDNLNPDPVPSARPVGSDLRDSKRRICPIFLRPFDLRRSRVQAAI